MLINLCSSPESSSTDSSPELFTVASKEQIYEVVGGYSHEAVDALYDAIGGNDTLDILVDGAQVKAILNAIRDAKMAEETQTVRVGDDCFHSAVTYYKGNVDMTVLSMSCFLGLL